MNNLNIKTAHICRTCMEEIINTSFFHLDFTQVDGEPMIGQKLSSCIPELDLSIVPNTVVCGKCADTINSLYIFKEECLKLEMQIRKYIQQVQHTGNDVDLAAVMQFQVHQLHSKNLTAELKTEACEKTENYKNEESPFCENYAFNETEKYTEVVNRDYLTSLQMVDRQCVLFNTFEDFTNSGEAEDNSDTTYNNSNVVQDCLLQVVENQTESYTEVVNREYLMSLEMVDRECVLFNSVKDFGNSGEAEENADTHDDSSIVQDCLLQIVENPDSCIQNLNKTDIDYQCFTCGHKAESKLKLIRHLYSHTGNKLYPNKISTKSNKTEYCKQLKSHMLTHTSEKPFKCSVCKYCCRQKNDLENHILIHTDEKPFKCSVCELNCNQKRNLNNHMLTHTGEKPFKCSNCEYSCNHKRSLKNHVLNHTGEKLFKCSVCEYSCKQKKYLKSHMLTHTDEKPFKCSICEHSFNHKGNLNMHLLTHTGEKPFKCVVCEYCCKQKNHLKNHMLTHTGEKPFKCSVCEYSCNHKHSLKNHMLSHTGEKLFKCSVCEYSCKQKKYLKSHMLTHTSEKPFKCSVCEYSCNFKGSLKSHMLTHTDEKPFKCSVCEYSCNHKHSLKNHMLSHTGEKLFKCSVCEYSCKQKKYLKSHMLTHTGEKPFKCSVCEYSCNHKHSLKNHILSHTGEKLFKCSVCEYRSTTRNQLKIHVQNHHGK